MKPKGDWTGAWVTSVKDGMENRTGLVYKHPRNGWVLEFEDGGQWWLPPDFDTEKLRRVDDEYLVRRVEKDPDFVTSRVFRECASPALRRKHPEAGVDFGFFDTKKNEGFLDRFGAHDPKRKPEFKVGDRVCYRCDRREEEEVGLRGVVTGIRVGTVRRVRRDRVVDFIYDVENDNTGGIWVGKIAKNLIPLDDYLRRRVAEDPTFVTSNSFQKYASPELKAEFPEAGIDFGFFGTRKVESIGSFLNESADRRFQIGDRIVVHVRGDWTGDVRLALEQTNGWSGTVIDMYGRGGYVVDFPNRTSGISEVPDRIRHGRGVLIYDIDLDPAAPVYKARRHRPSEDRPS